MYMVIDTETTGVEDTDKIVEVAGVRVSDDSILGFCDEVCYPGIPIPAVASSIHHLTDKHVFGKQTFDEVKSRYRSDVYIAHNAAFDMKMTGLVGKWICTLKCARSVWPDAPSHGNQVLRYWLNLEIPEFAKSVMPHRALHDAGVTAALFFELRKRLDIPEMLDISSKPSLLSTCHFGKHRGTKWSDVPHDYMLWCLKQDMDEDVIHTCRHYLGMN